MRFSRIRIHGAARRFLLFQNQLIEEADDDLNGLKPLADVECRFFGLFHHIVQVRIRRWQTA